MVIRCAKYLLPVNLLEHFEVLLPLFAASLVLPCEIVKTAVTYSTDDLHGGFSDRVGASSSNPEIVNLEP